MALGAADPRKPTGIVGSVARRSTGLSDGDIERLRLVGHQGLNMDMAIPPIGRMRVLGMAVLASRRSIVFGALHGMTTGTTVQGELTAGIQRLSAMNSRKSVVLRVRKDNHHGLAGNGNDTVAEELRIFGTALCKLSHETQNSQDHHLVEDAHK